MRWFAGRSAARLAAALDGQQAERPPDPEDRGLLAVADALSGLRLDAAPDPAFIAATRTRLVALAAERVAGEEPATKRPVSATPAPGRSPVSSHRHRLVVTAWSQRLAAAAAVLAVLVATLGLLVIASRDALPGDALYAVKRGSERAQVGLTFDPGERGFVLLHQAEQRLAEVSELLQEPASGLAAAGSPGVPLAAATDVEIVDTLAAMDEQTAAGIALLTGSAVASEDEATLGIIPVWAEGQQSLLNEIVPEMSTTEQARAEDSMALLDRVGERARSLGESLPCQCLEPDGPSDDLGPVPCLACAEGPPSDPPSLTPETTSSTPTS